MTQKSPSNTLIQGKSTVFDLNKYRQIKRRYFFSEGDMMKTKDDIRGKETLYNISFNKIYIIKKINK